MDISKDTYANTDDRPSPREGWHKKSRLEKPPEYPDRFAVPDHLVGWETDFPNYDPPYYVSPVVLANDSTINAKGWADPEEISLLSAPPRESLEGVLTIDSRGRPLNPIGRTGMMGRGLLGKWGPNYAADPIITRIGPDNGIMELLAIQRKDNGQWAIPGGMVDKGEEVTRTLARELREETGVELDMSKGILSYRGYVDDPRNTDHAWMETTARHMHIGGEMAQRMNLRAGDDARAARWLPLTPDTVGKLYASHSLLIKTAMTRMLKNNPFRLSEPELQMIETLVKALKPQV